MQDYRQILKLWFEGDIKENFHTKWFPPNGSDLQKQIDTLITVEYSDLLEKAYQNELNDWKGTPEGFVALILVMDQFSRHIYRDNKEKRIQMDERALSLSKEFLDLKLDQCVSTPMLIFALMPYRHSPNMDRLQHVLLKIDERAMEMDSQRDLLDKFRKTTQRKLLDLKECDATSSDDILEHYPFVADETDMSKNPLWKSMQSFLLQHNAQQHSYLAVSLSGGVDSMVIAKLLKKLSVQMNNFQIIAVHIDYANRAESQAERDFVEKWCNDLDIVFYARRIDEVTRGITRRDDYEKVSRDIRYDMYKQVMEKYKIPGMCFGHHRGDVQENVISNAMKGASLLDLNGMAPSSLVNGVVVWRPLLEHDKSEIFDFAHKYGVPYFKDTTPKWSTRGKLRNQLLPLLKDIYGEGFLKNLSTLGEESMQCGDIMHSKSLAPFFEKIIQTKIGVIIPCGEYTDEPIFFWKEALRHVCHNLLGTSMIRDKPMRELVSKFHRKHPRDGWVTLKKDNRSYLTQDQTLVLFTNSFFLQQSPLKEGTLIQVGQQYTLGSWSLLLSPSPYENLKQCQQSITMWDILRDSKVVYYLPHAPSYIASNDNRVNVLRSIDKVITDAIPLVITQGAFDQVDIETCMKVELNYHAIA